METDDRDGGRIRPLPPDPPDGAGPFPGGDAGTLRRGWRGWIPVGVAGAAVAVFVALTGGAAPPPAEGERDAGAAAPDTVTPTTAPATTSTTVAARPEPTLRERIPGLTQRLVLVYGQGQDTAVARWEPDSRVPNRPDWVSGRVGGGIPMFDADASTLAWTTHDGHETLWVGHPQHAVPLFVGVSGAAWHPERPRHLAWVGRPPAGDGARLYRVVVPPPSDDGIAAEGLLDRIEDLGPVTPGLRLQGWGDWGFVLSGGGDADTAGPAGPAVAVTQVRNGDGEVVRSTPGMVRAVSPTGQMVLAASPDAAIWAEVPGVADLGLAGDVVVVEPGGDGEHLVVVDLELAPVGALRGEADSLVYASDGTTVVAVALQGSRTVITSTDVAAGITRISTVDRQAMIAGFAGGGRYVVLYAWRSPDPGLVFHNWRHGTSHHVPFGQGRVSAVADAGPG